ncbi:SH3 domain-containing protein [Bacillus aquiflavi]|uniref:SH3 domain-containing protein n=1 Tax=Bacillus aquiflavi TaxID=2672567 RepID=A0A6B3W0S9_9BACI|nr:SH3 domain-containing protein [Bacillus aquiflavi]MBA4538427.1 SH3 domain-containing protein [Bacillus aquiflavi]NEY82792.1 SH3 domain-containing protein [Bacillus aquiflavi]
MQKKVIVFFISVILIFSSFESLQTIEAAAKGSVTIQSNSVNIRKGPGLSYPVITKAAKGETYTLLDEKDDWYEIKLKSGQKGWVANWLVSKKSTTNKNEKSSYSNKNATVATEYLRVRNGPGTNFQMIGHLNHGDKIEIIESNDSWVKGHTPFGIGWVSKEYITGDEQSSQDLNYEKVGIVTVQDLNVRNEPSLQGNIVGKLKKGTEITILSRKNDWIEITYGQASAWVSSKHIKLETKAQKNKNYQTTKAQKDRSVHLKGTVGTVTATALNVRKSNSLDGKVIGHVKKGQSFIILEEVNNWAKIEFSSGQYGWVAGWFLEKTENKGGKASVDEKSYVTILHNGTNLRKSPTVESSVIERANKGETYPIISKQNDWYEIQLEKDVTAFVAGWIVSVTGPIPKVEKPGAGIHLKNKTIVIDPGHGGKDNGAKGVKGTIEKHLTLKTAKLIHDKLRAAGANVILTRTNDTYISLPARVSTAEYYNADAFISIHYDSIKDKSVRGLTSYYYHSFQKPLADSIHRAVTANTKLRDRKVRQGDYYVLRENEQNAVLLELGYLSNGSEEILITSSQYQEIVANGVYNGLAQYFK